MGTIIKPRRGNKSTMEQPSKANTLLEEGELFIEFDDNPDTHKRHARVKIGDGQTLYGALPYVLGNAVNDERVDFLEDYRDSFTEVFADFISGKTITVLLPLIKRCIYLLSQAEAAIVSNVYTKNEVYTKTEADNNYYKKADVYTKTEADNNYYKKADVYTKDEINALLANYYSKSDVYTKTESNNNYYKKSETYTKEEVKDLVLIDVVTSDPSSTEVGQQWILKS